MSGSHPAGASDASTRRAPGSSGSDAPTSFGAILLAGGRASRMGGIDKPGLVVDGVSLRDRAVAAVRSVGADPIVVVGPLPDALARARHADPATTARAASGTGVRWVREEPPFTGPAAAIVAALAETPAEPAPTWTFLLACDLPHVDTAVRQLVDDILLLPSDTEGVCLADRSSRPQWLTGVYRTAALRRAAASLPDEGRDLSMRALLADLAIATLADRGDGALDIDTWEDYVRFTKETP